MANLPGNAVKCDKCGVRVLTSRDAYFHLVVVDGVRRPLDFCTATCMSKWLVAEFPESARPDFAATRALVDDWTDRDEYGRSLDEAVPPDDESGAESPDLPVDLSAFAGLRKQIPNHGIGGADAVLAFDAHRKAGL